MSPAPSGTRIQVISNRFHHRYRVGNIYRVHQIFEDGTITATDDQGIEGDFLVWADCEAVGIGWEWLRENLDKRSVDLLGAFDGLQNLHLRHDVETKLIASIPNLADKIVQILPEVEEALAIFKSAFQQVDFDDDFDAKPGWHGGVYPCPTSIPASSTSPHSDPATTG